MVDISLSVSPVRDRSGSIIGASKIARDITERKKAEERQDLLLREMDHRIKNLFALAIGTVSLSGRSARSVQDLVKSARERLSALARAYALTLLRGPGDEPQARKPTTLHPLIRTIISPHEDMAPRKASGLGSRDLTFRFPARRSRISRFCCTNSGTNSAKFGALSTPNGQIEIDGAEHGQTVVLTWTERGGPAIAGPPDREGFGATLTHATVTGQLGGEFSRTGGPKDLSSGYPCRVSV